MFKETESVIDSGYCEEVFILGLWKKGLLKVEQFLPKCKIIRIYVSSHCLPNNLFFSILKYLEWSIKVIVFICRNRIAIIHAHSLKALPVAVLAKFILNSTLVYDAHELETESNGLKGKLQIFCKVIERFLIKFTDEVITVSESIADYYKVQYSSTNPIVVRNIPRLPPQNVHRSNLRKKFKIHNNDLLFLYLGGFVYGRGIDLILNSFSSDLDKVHLAFIGSGILENKIRSVARLHSNVHLHEPVPSDQVITHAREADIGLCLIEDLCLSYRFSLPNKLFEYLLAGVPVILNDLPEQRKFVERYDCGWILSNPQSELGDFLKNLSLKEISDKKRGVDKARCELNWDTEVALYMKFVDRCFAQFDKT